MLTSLLRLPATIAVIAITHGAVVASEYDSLPWKRSTQFEETTATFTIEHKIRVYVNAPLNDKGHPAKATRLIVFACPNGNTLEYTMGRQMSPGLDWHYDGQHIAAQTRLIRSIEPDERIVLVITEAPGLSWPSFRKNIPDANVKIGKLVDEWRKQFGDDKTKVTLTGHSGGGAFMFGVIDSAEQIRPYIDRIAFLDANYSFDAALHAKKIEDWLNSDTTHRFIVVCYDDREIMLNGKKVVGPDGGTYRATGRMHDAFGKNIELIDLKSDPFEETTGLDGRIHFYRHPNPKNKILHTVLVGEMNGLVQIETLGTPFEGQWGTFGGPRAYTKFVQAEQTPTDATPPKSPAPQATEPAKKLPTAPQSNLPPRSTNAIGGSEFVKKFKPVAINDRKAIEAAVKEREAAILHEISTGNFPEFLRTFKTVEIRGALKAGETGDVTAKLEVMPDFLAIGSDTDFVRMPMTPQTAQKIADQFGCVLPTRKMVDAIDSQAELKLEPHPMTEAREALATFAEHNQIIEAQRAGKPLGLLVTGIKKDIVLTPRIFEKPRRLAIYGWRQLNGQPIQPLTIVHWDQYVDYSHGVRLVHDTIELDGKPTKIAELLSDPDRCGLVSDEGPMQPPRYPDN